MSSTTSSGLEDLVQEVRRYDPDVDEALIRRAYEFSAQVHGHQTRLTGEPYVTHPLAVARILAEIDSDVLTVVAGLLHDTIEDGKIEDGRPVTREIIEERFGSEIALLVDGVSKLKKHSFQSRAEAQAQNFRKMFVNMASDIRVVSSSSRTVYTTCAP